MPYIEECTKLWGGWGTPHPIPRVGVLLQPNQGYYNQTRIISISKIKIFQTWVMFQLADKHFKRN